MSRPPSLQPTEGELQILNVLWEAGPCELGAVRAALQRTKGAVATTTVATMLKVMESKGLVGRADGEGRGALWSAKVSKKSAQAGLLRRLLDVAFDGSAGRLVAHMLEEKALTNVDRETIRGLLDEKATPAKRKGGKK